MDQFSNPLEDPHPIRLLTLARVLTSPAPDVMTSSTGAAGVGGETSLGGGGSGGAAPPPGGGGGGAAAPIEAHTLCLTVELAARDRSLMVSTVERTYDFLSAAAKPPGKRRMWLG